jgi:hypothetical protein
MESITNLEQNNDTNCDEANNQQINDSHHQQQEIVASEITDHQSSDQSNNGNNGHQHKSPENTRSSTIHERHMSSHHSDDGEGVQQGRHAIIDAHTHVITETPHTAQHQSVSQLKREPQHSPPNSSSGNIVDHSGHGSPIQLSQATVGHSIDDKQGVSQGSSDALHSHLYSNYHQQHHQTRYSERVPINRFCGRFESN